LLKFFRRVYRLLRPGGIFILEPQDWEGYKKAKRVDCVSGYLRSFQNCVAKWSQKLAENARRLKLRPEIFEEELGKIGLKLEEAYGTPGQGGMYPNLYIQAHSNADRETGFKRPLYAYRKPS
jgi:7SK snRNA methylphosphate capping enzyme